MSGPLAGLGQQPTSLTQPAQNVVNDQSRVVRNEDQRPQENQIQSREAALAQSNQSNQNNLESFRDNLADAQAASDSQEPQPRGSLIDVVV